MEVLSAALKKKLTPCYLVFPWCPSPGASIAKVFLPYSLINLLLCCSQATKVSLRAEYIRKILRL